MQLRTPFQGEPLRPALAEPLCDENINKLLKACWSENPDHRPPFGSIRRQLRDNSPDRSGSDVIQLHTISKNLPIYKNGLCFSMAVMQIYWTTWWKSWRNMQITWRRWWKRGPISSQQRRPVQTSFCPVCYQGNRCISIFSINYATFIYVMQITTISLKR